MSDGSLRVGVLGCGAIARAFHLGALRENRDVRITAIADENESNLALAGETAGEAKRFRTIESLLGSDVVDAVVVCLPPALHADAGIDAFRAGCHVYMEKPIATARADALRLVDAWRASGRIGMMGFNFRLHPQFADLKHRLASGEIGKLIAVRTTFTIPAHEVPHWKRARASGGGVLLDLASHHVDLVEHILDDKVGSVFASASSLSSEFDHATVQLTTTRGTSVQSLFSLRTAESHRIELWGTGGQLVADRSEQVDVAFIPASYSGARTRRVRSALGQFRPGQLLRSAALEPSFAKALGVFVAASRSAMRGVDGAPRLKPDLEDGMRSLAVVEAIERSIDSGRPELVS